VYLENNFHFDFVINCEGYESKRLYDPLLSRRGKSPIDKSLQHTDSERYGFWACKGGVPIERVDDWIQGARGVGTYTYLHAFVDCDAFELTANRGSVRNTNLEILNQVRSRVNDIFWDKKTQSILSEREQIEEFEKTIRMIDEDASELKTRYAFSSAKKAITLPDGSSVREPTARKGGYSESETLILLMQLLDKYPDLFKFSFLDYNTTKGIDFVVEHAGSPKYVELKGTFQKKINHSLRNIYKFVCYDLDIGDGDVIEDVELFKVKLRVNKKDKFESFDTRFNGNEYTSYQLIPESAILQSVEIIVLKSLLSELIGAVMK
jgi:hypothetical protein